VYDFGRRGRRTRWDLPQNISHKEDRNTRLILCGREVELFLKVIQPSDGDGIPIKIVEPIHDPEHGEDDPIQLANKSNFGGIGLAASACVISRCRSMAFMFLQVMTLALLLVLSQLVSAWSLRHVVVCL
jgi:hypothetical protein